METGIGSFIIRKLVTTFVAATIFSVLLSLFSLKGSSEIVYNHGIISSVGSSFI